MLYRLANTLPRVRALSSLAHIRAKVSLLVTFDADFMNNK